MTRVLTVYRDRAYAEPYVAALRTGGLDTVLVSADERPSLQGISGLLLMGGSDVDPSRFGQPPAPETEAPDSARDALESALIAEALARDLPILGICRGLQMLNVQQGGTLTQHLASVGRHRQKPADQAQPAHGVTIVPGTLLASIADASTSWEVNSRHHQGIETLAPGLRVAAVDPDDGTIEAIERPDRRFVLAVQWHPENQAPVDAEQRKLFRAFADACHETGSMSTETSSV